MSDIQLNFFEENDEQIDNKQEVIYKIRRERIIIKEEYLKLNNKIDDEFKKSELNFNMNSWYYSRKINELEMKVNKINEKMKKGYKLNDTLKKNEGLLNKEKDKLEILISNRILKEDIAKKYHEQKFSLDNRYNNLKMRYNKLKIELKNNNDKN